MDTTHPQETESFEALFERHARTIYNFCFRRTGDWAQAEDLTSVVFLEALRRRGQVDLIEEPGLPWLYGVATNVVRNARARYAGIGRRWSGCPQPSDARLRR